MFSLANKTALVTGSGSGIGRAIAQLFARQGALVWIVDRDARAGAAATAEIRAAGGRAESAEVDISDPAAVAALAARVPSRGDGGVKGLVARLFGR